MNDPTYEMPMLRVYGSVHELTKDLDKCGSSLDALSQIQLQNGPLTGDIVDESECSP